MVLPFKELVDPTVREKIHGRWIEERFTAGNRHKVAAVISPLEIEGKNQMRRTLKEAAYAGCGDGGLPSKIHAPVRLGARNLAVVPKTTAPPRTAVS